MDRVRRRRAHLVQADAWSEKRVDSFDLKMVLNGAPSPGEMMTVIYRVEFVSGEALMGSNVLSASTRFLARPADIDDGGPTPPGDSGDPGDDSGPVGDPGGGETGPGGGALG